MPDQQMQYQGVSVYRGRRLCKDMAQCLGCINRPAEPALYKADDSQSEDESEKELHDDSRDKEIY